MEIEQLPPNKPNFLLILVLFVIAILAILLASYLVVRRAEKQTPHGQSAAAYLPAYVIQAPELRAV
jgi:flagellar basal body-associated protein FliL